MRLRRPGFVVVPAKALRGSQGSTDRRGAWSAALLVVSRAVPAAPELPLVHAGDRVAVLSLSSRGPARFPAPYELGLKRVAAMGLRPVEYPTTRAASATPEERARDLMAAWADPGIAAVLTSIGGRDQHLVVPLLDPALFTTTHKRFLGYSDNTHVLTFLDRCGVVGLHGGVVMVEWGRPGGLHPTTGQSLHQALFTGGRFDLPEGEETTDCNQFDWDQPATLTRLPRLAPGEPPGWSGPAKVVEGRAWGGALEAVETMLELDRLAPSREYAGRVLLLETSLQESPEYVERVITGLHDYGLLGEVTAVMIGRPKAWTHDRPWPVARRARYVGEQRNRIAAVLDRLAPRAMVVQGLDVGHTDPQVVVPIGGRVRVDGRRHRITVWY